MRETIVAVGAGSGRWAGRPGRPGGHRPHVQEPYAPARPSP